MPVKLEGSCRCGAVHFSVKSHAPYPYQLCYCSICRKTAGGGGFAINLSGESKSLKTRGKKAIGVFRAEIKDDHGHCETSSGERNFCTKCGTALWALRSRMARIGASFCLGDRHQAAGAAVQSASDAEIQSSMGEAGFRAR